MHPATPGLPLLLLAGHAAAQAPAFDAHVQL